MGMAAHPLPNPTGVELTKVRPLQGWEYLPTSLSEGSTYGYSRYPASRDPPRARRVSAAGHPPLFPLILLRILRMMSVPTGVAHDHV